MPNFSTKMCTQFWSQHVHQNCCYYRVLLLGVGGLQIGPNLLKISTLHLC